MAAAKLTPPQMAALNRLLDEALDLPPDERAAWLDRLTGTPAELVPALRDLLSRTDKVEAANFLGVPPGVLLPPGSARTADLAPDTLVGPYRLVRELGQGGMGSVWLAERTDGLVRRPVALKLPHGAWPRSQLAERLQRERDILAGLEHPNIARLYDAGLTPAGQPWLALEYVEGIPIDTFCRGADGRPPLAVTDRVRLLLQVARAVAYAHGKLILHRDLKPQNILVTPDGVGHLLDFGIAKLLTEGETRDTQLTQLSGRALSPDFASPEQVRGEALGVTSDIYSLGVVLYELLTGARPYRLTRNSRGELEDAILHAEPRRPSDVATGDDRAALRGDLDIIVLRALKKSPAERYPTAHAFIDDLERALDGRPVLARADTLRYRTGKFVRRHRVAVATATVLLVTLVAGVVGTTIGMIRARRAEAAARTEAATAERYSKFLVDMFEVATPGESKGPDVTAREILQKGTARIRHDLAGDPALEARLLTTIGGVNTRLGLYPEARETLEEAVTILRQDVDGGADLALALVRRGEVERYLNEPDEAARDDREGLALFERAYGPDDVRIVPALTELGLLLRVSDPEQALRLDRRAHALLVAARGEADGDAAVVLQNIAGIHLRAYRLREAQAAYESALPHLVEHFGEKDPHVGTVLSNLADLHRNLGDYARADEMARHCLEVDTAVSGGDHPDVGVDWLQLARVSDKLGDTGLAIEQIDKAIAIFRQHLTAAHPLRIQAANFKAGFLIEQGRFDEARRTLNEFDQTAPAGVETNRNLLRRLLVLAEIERLERRWPTSQALAERVLADPGGAGDHFLETDARWAHAFALALQSRTAEAEAERVRALDLLAAADGKAPFAGVVAHAKYYACAGNPARALGILRDAVAQGFHDPIVLHDPTLAALRERAEFAPIIAAVTPARAHGTAPPR